MTLGRRRFVAVVGAALAAPLVPACGPPPPPAWGELAARAAGCFLPEDLDAVRRVGAVLLDRWGRDREALEPELAPTLAALEAPPADCFEAAIVRDFAALELRDAAGWTLAATEAHLAALVALFDVTTGTVVTDAG